MAELIDKRSLDADELSTIEELEKELKSPEEATAAPTDKAQEPQDFEAPEKYKGKSLKDLIQMHQEADRVIGRQGSEVGELRKIVDDFITKQTELVASKEQSDDDDTDFFTDPKKAVSRTVENHPAFKELKELTAAQKQSTAMAEMQRRHPDSQQIIADPSFMEWVMASKVRQNLLVSADRNYDVDAADELFNLWKERKAMTSQVAATEKQARKSSVQQASTGSGAVSGDPQGRKKKYRRADIINLMRTDPRRYEALLPEIRQAYQENRVV